MSTLLALAIVSTVRRAAADELPPADAPAKPPSDPAPTSNDEGNSAAPTVPKNDQHMVLWSTLTPSGDGSTLAIHKPLTSEPRVRVRAQELDATLQDVVQDLGFRIDVGGPEATPERASELTFIELAKSGAWVVSPRIEEQSGGRFLLRMVMVAPGTDRVIVRVAQLTGGDVAAKGIVLLREELRRAAGQRAGPSDNATAATPKEETRSAGRPILAVAGGLFGAFSAFSVQQSSGSDDPRVLYPLLAIGTGVGVGAALLASEEWDVTSGNAWFLSASAFWGVSAGVSLANGQNILPLRDRYAWGLGGGLLGLGVGSLALVKYKMDEGDAALVASGGGVGAAAGGLIELAYRGSIETPQTGSAIGVAVGVVSTTILATRVRTSPGRVVLVDAGAALGLLGGAALASPLVFENVTPWKSRAFIGASLVGMGIGAVLALTVTKPEPKAPDHVEPSPLARQRPQSPRLKPSIQPLLGVIGESATRNGKVPAWGVGFSGTM